MHVRRPTTLEELIELTSGALIVARRDGRIEWLSRAAVELLQRRFSGVVGRLPESLRAAGQHARIEDASSMGAQYRLSLPGTVLSVREVRLGFLRLLAVEERTLRRERARARPFGLTRREEEILDLLTLGKTNAEIAEILLSKPLTVKKHLEHIYSKLDVRSRTAAAAFFLRNAPRSRRRARRLSR